jgi:hypothetical protein
MPPGSVIGRPSQLPLVCQELAFSTEEDFVTQGPEPPDGNPIISDGDLLSSTANGCVICARNIEMLSVFDLQEVDLGLDAADVIDAERALVAFSTELDSPNVGQFTAGDLLATNGMVIANVALTHLYGVGYDIGLDAVHFVGDPVQISGFLQEATQYSRNDWLLDPGKLAELLAEPHGIDIWFSTEGTHGAVESPIFLDGDLLSVRGGKIAGNESLLLGTVPAGIPVRGVDFGLDAVTDARIPEGQLMVFSTELLFEGDPSFTDGDVLQAGNGAIAKNSDLVACFEPKASELGLDALYKAFDEGLDIDLYLPLILRNVE